MFYRKRSLGAPKDRRASASRRYNEHLINDWSLGKQLILFPENLKVSRGGALTICMKKPEIPERIQMNLTVHPGGKIYLYFVNCTTQSRPCFR